MKKIIMTKDAPAPIGPYSQAVEAGGFLFCSGQIALDPHTGQIATTEVSKQAELVMKHVGSLLKEAGLTFDHVVKSTIFLTNMGDFPAVNEVYSRHFTTQPPARSTVAVVGLPKEVKVEVEVIAHRG